MKTLQAGSKVLIKATVIAEDYHDNNLSVRVELPNDMKIWIDPSDLTVCETAEPIDINNFCIDITDPVNAELLPRFMKDMAHVSDPRYKYYGKERGNRFGSLQNTRAHLNLTTLPALQKQHPGVFEPQQNDEWRPNNGESKWEWTKQTEWQPTPSFKSGQEVEVFTIKKNVKIIAATEGFVWGIIDGDSDPSTISVKNIRPIPAQPTVESELLDELTTYLFDKGHRINKPLVSDILAWHQKHSGRVEVSVPSDEDIDNAIDQYGFQIPYDGSNKFYNDDKIKHFKAGVDWFRHFMTRKEAK